MNASVDERVLRILQGTLEADASIRHAAEEALKASFKEAEVGLQLAAILLSPQIEIHLRQMSASQLLKYVDTHWFALADKFEEPITPREVRHAVRQIVFQGLGVGEEKIRVACAYAIALIAKSDWPDDWPNLLNDLIQLLQHGSRIQVHGAMQVVLEFVRDDLGEDQLLPVASDLLPPLLAIFQDNQHTAATRAKTVGVFEELLKMLENVKEEHPEAVKHSLDQVGPQWLEAFGKATADVRAIEAGQEWDLLNLRKAIFKCLESFESIFPHFIKPYRQRFVEIAAVNLRSFLPAVFANIINVTEDTGSDVATDLDSLVCQVLEYLQPVTRAKNVKTLLIENGKDGERATALLQSLIAASLAITEVSVEQVEQWTDDPSEYIADDDEGMGQYGRRSAALDLVASLIDMFPRPVGRVLWSLTEQSTSKSAAERQSGNTNWWKPLEAALAALGAMADDLRSLAEDEEKAGLPATVNLKHIFDHIVPSLLQQSDSPFLQGRAFVFASSFASLLPAPLAGEYLAAAVNVLQAHDVSVLVKISAVKAIKNFCRHVDAVVLQPHSAKVLAQLTPLVPQAHGETLYLVLETIRAVLALDKDILTPTATRDLAETIWPIWLQFADDPVLTAIVEELFEAIASLPVQPVILALVHSVAPKLASVIETPTTSDTVHLPGEAVQLANSLIRTRGGPLEPELVGTVTVAVMRCLVHTDDMDVIQHGMIHLTQVVRKDCDKLIQWRDGDGTNGIAFTFHLLARFLQPSFSESGGIFVGELIMHLFRKAGSTMGPVLPDLLRAVVTRLASARMATFIQSLVLPFAYLFGTEYTQSTIDLLSSFAVDMPDGSTKPALNLVLESWCDTSDTITGSWNIRVSAIGLSKLFAIPNSPLSNVAVKGDLVISDVNRQTIMTRSRTITNPNEYTSIPFPLKALKLILKDVQIVKQGEKGKTAGPSASAGSDIEEDDGDEDWDDDDPLAEIGAGAGEFDFLSSWLDESPGETTAQDDDEDLRQDPIAQLDLGDHLVGILRHAYTTNDNGMHELVQGLDEGEKGILRGVLTF